MSEIPNLYGGAMMPSMMTPPGQNQLSKQKINVGVKSNNVKGNNNVNNANNAKGNNKNGLSNANKNILNNLNIEIQERIGRIKLNDDKRVIAFWICCGLSVILLLSTFITTPIRYSEKEAIYKLSYNKLYYYVTLLLITLISVYVYKGRGRLPLIYGEDMYIQIIPVVVLFLSLIVINIFDSPSEKEDGSFNTPPSTLVRDKRVMIAQYVLLILLLLGMVGLDLIKSGNGFSNIKPHHINRTLPVLIVILVVGYLLYNSVKYNVKRYDLPETWRK
jgi:hypothetical protein